MKAAGILFVTQQGKALFLKRSASGDHPGEWCCPGGKLEEPESLEDCAVRETLEETGQVVPLTSIREHTKTFTPFPMAPLPLLHNEMGDVANPSEQDGVEFTTYVTDASEEFIPFLNHEHEAFAWAPVDSPPEPLHRGMAIALRRFSMNELDIAKAMAAGELTSPQRYQNIHLWAMRITGTGKSYRDKREEHVWRDPGIYMNQEMLDRMRAVPIIMAHPQERATLDSEEFHERVVGTVQWPYLVPEAQEVWGITRIYDDATNQLLWQGQEDGQPLSTSPSVTLGLRSGSQKIRLEDGSPLLIEGIPTYIDHLAICRKGVWDKGGDPAGVQLNDSNGDEEMADYGEKIDKMLEHLDSYGKRMDAMEQRMNDDDARRDAAKKDAAATDESKEEEKKDSEEKDPAGEKDASEEKKDASEEKDASKKDAETSDRKDAGEKEEKKDSEDRDDGLKEFAAKFERKDEDKKEDDSVNDSVELRNRLHRLEKAMPRQLTDADYHAMIEAQSRADSAYGVLGIGRAPIPQNGEDLNGYRRRVATKLKAHSKRWGKTNLYNIQDDAFDTVENDIYNDANAAALSADDVPEGQMRAIVKHDMAGRPITEYLGEPSAWMNQFGGYKRRLSGIRNERNY